MQREALFEHLLSISSPPPPHSPAACLQHVGAARCVRGNASAPRKEMVTSDIALAVSVGLLCKGYEPAPGSVYRRSTAGYPEAAPSLSTCAMSMTEQRQHKPSTTPVQQHVKTSAATAAAQCQHQSSAISSTGPVQVQYRANIREVWDLCRAEAVPIPCQGARKVEETFGSHCAIGSAWEHWYRDRPILMLETGERFPVGPDMDSCAWERRRLMCSRKFCVNWAWGPKFLLGRSLA